MFRTALLLLALVSQTSAWADSAQDGELIASAPCEPKPTQTYREYVRATKKWPSVDVQMANEEDFRIVVPKATYLLTQQEFETRSAYAGFECLQLRYRSDGIEVTASLWKPRDVAIKKLPLIVYNHGGSGGPGRLNPWAQFGFYNFLAEGFVVIGSHYRGAAEGHDEYGGADVHDVMNLRPLAASLGYIDMDNVFMLGRSRGGMITYLAMKNGFVLNAAATEAGNPNLIEESQRRPIFASGLREAVPDFSERREEVLRERSAEFWPEQITAPLLILHGSADWRVQAATQERFARVLQAAGKPFELHIYEGDDHGLTMNRGDADRRVMDWFKAHMK